MFFKVLTKFKNHLNVLNSMFWFKYLMMYNKTNFVYNIRYFEIIIWLSDIVL